MSRAAPRWARALAVVEPNVSERLLVCWRPRIASLVFLVAVADETFCREQEIDLPVLSLKTIAQALLEEGGVHRIPLGDGRVLVMLPRPRGGVMLAITGPSGARLLRATLLRKYQRRELAAGIDHARACAGDVTLLEDTGAST